MLGETVRYGDESYEVRGMVDNRYVVRLRNRKTGVERYKVWTETDRAEFDRSRTEAADRADRNAEIYERVLAGETKTALAREFNLSATSIAGICGAQARREKNRARVRAHGMD